MVSVGDGAEKLLERVIAQHIRHGLIGGNQFSFWGCLKDALLRIFKNASILSHSLAKLFLCPPVFGIVTDALDARNDLTPGVRTELVRKSRYLHKNSGFVRELVGNMAIYSTGDGIRVQAQSAKPGWNRAAEDYFALWSARCC